jgi:diacylglycerol kinase (ATP)
VSQASGAARRLGVVVNPTAGKGRGARVGQAVLDDLVARGHDVHDLSGRNGDLALEHAHRAVADGLDALVVVGGDGMVHLGVQAVAGTGTPLGIVAVGTGNDFAATLGLPVGDPAASGAALCAALDAGTGGVRAVDAVHVSGPGVPRPHDGAPHARWCAGALSAGLDAAVNARANAMLRPRGSSRYTIAAVQEIFGYRPWSYTLRFEGVVDDGGLPLEPANPGHDGHDGHDGIEEGGDRTGTWSGRAAMVTAANGPQIGGGIKVAPHASVTDGYLDVLVATDLTRVGAASIFPTMFSGRHVGRRKVHVVRARAVDIEPGPHAHDPDVPPMPAAFADGEHVGPLPLRAQAHPGALAVLTPPPRA